MKEEQQLKKELEKIEKSKVLTGIKIIRSITAIRKTAIKQKKESDDFRVKKFKHKVKKEAVDKYINPLVSDKITLSSGGQKTEYGSIHKVINECHFDVQNYITENKPRSYKSTAEGLEIRLQNNTTLLIACLARNRKQITLKEGRNVLKTVITESPYPYILKKGVSV